MTLELTDEESRVLINLLDVSVKSAGLQAAESALHFVRKINEAANAAKAAPADPELDLVQKD